MSSKKYEDELMAGSDEDSHDAYLEQMKAEGAERDDDDSESSEGGLSVYQKGFSLKFFRYYDYDYDYDYDYFCFFINSIVNTEWLSKSHLCRITRITRAL